MLRQVRASIPLFIVIVFSFVFCITVLPSTSAAPLTQTSDDFVEVQRLKASDGAPGDNFGDYFEVDGNTLLATSEKGVYIFGFNGSYWAEQTKLHTNDGIPLETGIIRGDTAVGISPYDYFSSREFRVYIFTRNGTTWTQQAVLQQNEAGLRFFRKAAFLDDNTLLVGTSPNFDLQLNGAIYIYKRSGTTWTLQDTLTTSDGLPVSNNLNLRDFGNFYILDNSTILVGAFSGDQFYKGNVYVFARSGNDWSEVGKLNASDAQEADHFGYSFAAEGNTLFISAIGAGSPSDEYADPPGAVYVFSRSGNTFTEQQKLTLPQDNPQQFGSFMALQGTSILISDSRSGNNYGPLGHVYEYTYSGSSWVQQTELSPAFPKPNWPAGAGGFGRSVIRQENLAIVSAPSYSPVYASRRPGRVSIFAKDAGIWVERQILEPADLVGMYYFGSYVELEDDRLFIGAPGSFATDTPGEIYIYEQNGTPQISDLLVNGGFDDSQTNGVPAGWTRKNTTKDERRCNREFSIVAYSGNCAYFMKGSSSTGGKLAQNVNLSQFNLQAGDVVRLNGFYNKQSTGSVYVYLYVNYANFPEDERRIILTQPTPNQGYQPINQSTITLKEAPTRIRVVLENQTTSGKTWFDGLNLIATTGSQNNLLSLPIGLETVDEVPQTESLIPLP